MNKCFFQLIFPIQQCFQKCVHSRDGFFTILSPRETVSKLGISKLVQSASCCNTEVTPHVLIAAEIQLLHCSRAWLETLQSDKQTTFNFFMSQTKTS